ncbi:MULTISPECIES: transposase [unclassified Streptomyces]|uniref:IS701 family transposase n=1 Tax=unclassified Streptomyces TaxID=2593676 RepID=UPI0033BB34C2
MTNPTRRVGHAAAGTAVHPDAGHGSGGGLPDVLEDFCAELFSSLRRKDQQLKARQYLRGLLATKGRKSIRNVATSTGDPAAAQSLHHFIVNSTWDWRPTRAALAAYAERVAPGHALVVHPMPIPRAGGQFVGVDEMFDPFLRRTFHGQLAYGVWSASPALSAPVDWLLFLSGRGFLESGSPSRAAGDRDGQPPAQLGSEGGDTPESCAVTAALTTPRDTWTRGRPVVLNVPGTATPTTMARFREDATPVLVRAGLSTRLAVTDRGMPGYGHGSFPAHVILEAARSARRPVRRIAPRDTRPTAFSLAVAVPVRLANEPGGGARYLLIGEWCDPKRPPERLWLTDMAETPLQRLVEYAGLADRVDRDASRAAETVGLRDFGGRSLAGWHRHVTLASAAYIASELVRGSGTAPRRGGKAHRAARSCLRL